MYGPEATMQLVAVKAEELLVLQLNVCVAGSFWPYMRRLVPALMRTVAFVPRG
jgi:hypothetical protein